MYKWRNSVCSVIILRRDKLPANVRRFPIFGGANKVDNNGLTSASTRDNFPRANVRKFFGCFSRAFYLSISIPTDRKLNFDSVCRTTSQNSILKQCFHKVWQYSLIFTVCTRNSVTNQLTRPKRCVFRSIYFNLNLLCSAFFKTTIFSICQKNIYVHWKKYWNHICALNILTVEIHKYLFHVDFTWKSSLKIDVNHFYEIVSDQDERNI